LRPDKVALEIEDQVVALVDTEGEQRSVSTTDELGQNRALGPLPDVDGVIAEPWCLSS
jgi:hypothetical protein